MSRRGLFTGVLSGWLVSCRQSAPRLGGGDGALERYPMRGLVIRVDERLRVVTVKHGPIRSEEGKLWMDAMTMEFPLGPKEDPKKVAPGKAIEATVVTRASDAEYWIENIRP